MLERSPLISCIMPTYGRPDFLGEAVAMFLAQDYPEKELVILNDCEGQQFACSSPGVRVINVASRYRSLGDKRNACIELARGNIIAVWDDDDINLPWRLTHSCDEMRRLQREIYLPDSYFTYRGAETLGESRAAEGGAYHGMAIFTRELWEKAGGYPSKGVGEDAEFFRKVKAVTGLQDLTVAIAPTRRFYVLRATSLYQHMSMAGGVREPDTSPLDRIITPEPLQDGTLRAGCFLLLQQYRASLFPATPFGKETPPVETPILSVCVSVKNRSRVRHGDQELLLFPHCVKSLASAAQELHALGKIELVIADFDSDDWPLEEWIEPYWESMTVVIVPVHDDFSRGAGLNLAAERASSDTLLFLDADMLVEAGFLKACIRNASEHFALFPVMRRLDENGGEREWDAWSYGISCMSRKVFEASGGLPPFKSWGGEDDVFHARVSSLIAVKRERIPGLLHQWHPEKCRHENYVHARKSDYESFVCDPRQQTNGRIRTIYWAEHPHWKGYLHLLEGGRMCRPGGDAGSYEWIEGRHLILRWDRWKMVKLLWRDEEGIFATEDGTFTLREQEKNIAAAYENFWPNFSPQSAADYFPFSVLSRLPIRIGSVFGQTDSTYDLLFSGENLEEMSHDGSTFTVAKGGNSKLIRSHWFLGVPWMEHPNALHLPLFYYYWDMYQKSGILAKEREVNAEREFGISVLIQNHSIGNLTKRRWEIAHELSHFFPVHGLESMRSFAPEDSKMIYHPVGKTLVDKMTFLSRYTHHLCMENASARGYVTEKIFDALYAGAVPIYQGDPHVVEWVEPSAVVACDNLTVEMIVAKIRESEWLTQMVQRERERLCKVTLEEMTSRLEDFVRKIDEA